MLQQPVLTLFQKYWNLAEIFLLASVSVLPSKYATELQPIQIIDTTTYSYLSCPSKMSDGGLWEKKKKKNKNSWEWDYSQQYAI